MHPTTDRPFTCVSCEGQIVGNVEFHVGLPFCCAGCVAGGPCTCSYDVDQLRRRDGRSRGGDRPRRGPRLTDVPRVCSDRGFDPVESSPLAVAALGFVERGATAADLERRFDDAGADLRPGVAEALLGELQSLGLVRVARGGDDRRYVLTSLGQRVVGRGSWTDAAVPMKDLERLRTDLLSTIAHELRTPLTVMRTLTGLLLDPASEPTDEQRRTMLETIERNAERMQRLIGDILELARFRSGTIGSSCAGSTRASSPNRRRPRPARSPTSAARPWTCSVPGRRRSARLRRPAAPRAAPCSTSSRTPSGSPQTRATSRCGWSRPTRTARSLVGHGRRARHLRRGPGAAVRAVLRRPAATRRGAGRRRPRPADARSRSPRRTAGRSRSTAASGRGARSAWSCPPPGRRRTA